MSAITSCPFCRSDLTIPITCGRGAVACPTCCGVFRPAPAATVTGAAFESFAGDAYPEAGGRVPYRGGGRGGIESFGILLGVLLLAGIAGLMGYRAVEDARDRDPAIQRERDTLREAEADYRKTERDRRSAAVRLDEEMKILNHGR